jgi:hypothetical protein
MFSVLMLPFTPFSVLFTITHFQFASKLGHALLVVNWLLCDALGSELQFFDLKHSDPKPEW